MLSRPQIMGRAVSVAAQRLRRCGRDPLAADASSALFVLQWHHPGPICAWAQSCTELEYRRWRTIWRAWQWMHRRRRGT